MGCWCPCFLAIGMQERLWPVTQGAGCPEGPLSMEKPWSVVSWVLSAETATWVLAGSASLPPRVGARELRLLGAWFHLHEERGTHLTSLAGRAGAGALASAGVGTFFFCSTGGGTQGPTPARQALHPCGVRARYGCVGPGRPGSRLQDVGPAGPRPLGRPGLQASSPSPRGLMTGRGTGRLRLEGPRVWPPDMLWPIECGRSDM